MTLQVLCTSAEIHAGIKRIFGEPDDNDDRVALVAYVGADADRYLPPPEGLRLICTFHQAGRNPTRYVG